jgi:hypothetical protein
VGQGFSEALNMTEQTYLTQLPFPAGDGTTRCCVAGAERFTLKNAL